MPAKKTQSRRSKETFQLEAPQAGGVLLAGDFTGWESEPIRMKRSRDGLWKATVNLEPGSHQYRFVVDGEWMDDPHASAHEANAFGSQNCVRIVSAP